MIQTNKIYWKWKMNPGKSNTNPTFTPGTSRPSSSSYKQAISDSCWLVGEVPETIAQRTWRTEIFKGWLTVFYFYLLVYYLHFVETKQSRRQQLSGFTWFPRGEVRHWFGAESGAAENQYYNTSRESTRNGKRLPALPAFGAKNHSRRSEEPTEETVLQGEKAAAYWC